MRDLAAQDAAHLTLTLRSACSAHFSFAHPFGTPLGLDIHHPDFVQHRHGHLRQVPLMLLP